MWNSITWDMQLIVLNEIPAIIENMSQDDYDLIKNNVLDMAQKLRHGEHIRSAIESLSATLSSKK